MTTPQTGQLRIVPRFHWSAFTMAAFKPRASINGHEVQLNWGENVLPAPLGVHNIEIHIPYLWKMGKANITVDNTSGVPTVHYSAPMINFMGGAVGLTQQKYPGMLAMLIMLGVVGLVVVLCCAGAVLSGGN
ncbi:hypothetical protein Rhe02_26350 [Rhizocola hellebori]|uniref:Uncharacterized protein n=1 Tax=Rhizocola hellebori TaxID=1392758 RepID=A0A8J3Q799_9ACTN|nr:hypothetical protein [Rhizocola hellebori]GIH04568.1 hypothetical protein Rhe02_26350 [Rhizocola hellebori]